MIPYKQRGEERFEKVKIQNLDENETNKDNQQNEHIIIVSQTQLCNYILLVCIANCSRYLTYILTHLISFFIVINVNMVCVYLLL